MTQVRKINENNLDELLKEITVRGEQIRSLQDEKQSVMDEFRKECNRFRNGQISERSLVESTKKVNDELAALDLKIRKSIRESRINARKANVYVESHEPERYRATHRGIVRVAIKKRRAPRKRIIRRARKAAKARRPARARARRPARARARRPARARARRPARARARRPARRKSQRSAKRRRR